MALSYADVLGRLVSARRFGVKLGLERMRALLDALGSPDQRLGTVIHVAGTNGKGSTVAMIAALAASGRERVATYTSPHLSTLRERIVIDGAMVTEQQVVDAYARVEAAGGAELTFFEQVTAIALVLIADAHVGITVLEVGLGGRLDATNAVDATIPVITGVAFDHEAILGNTLDAIAFEKAGICKPGQSVVIGTSGEQEGLPLLIAHARAAGASSIAIAVDPADASTIREQLRPMGAGGRLGLVTADSAELAHVGLAGAHQRRNAALALTVIHALRMPFDPAALATVRHPGRFEVIEDKRLILDGAHNPHGARALASALRDRRGTRDTRPVLVLAVSADKDLREIASALVPEASAVIATRYQQERAAHPEALAEVLREVAAALGLEVPVETAPDVVSALAAARARGGWTVVAGSLFIVGEARVAELGAPADPVVATDPVAVRT